jgi:hypothetical protein
VAGPSAHNLERVSVRASPLTLPAAVGGRLRWVARAVTRRYLVASSFLAGFVAVAAAGALMSPSAWSAVMTWTSTSVANMEHHPLGSLAASAFVAEGTAYAWPVLIAMAMFGANRALGNARTAAVCAAGHVIGTLVSEGIVAYRVDEGLLPAASRHILDIGPSYVLVSAIVVAVVFGSWPARVAAAGDMAVLVVAGHIFSGLADLDVAAVGHLTALVVAAVAAALIRHRRNPPASGRGASQDATAPMRAPTP